MPHVFAAGDVVTGPTMITTAVGQGRRAAFMIDRWLQGRHGRPTPSTSRCRVVDKDEVLGRQDVYDRRAPLEAQRRHERRADATSPRPKPP